jgi:hypothetical protein
MNTNEMEFLDTSDPDFVDKLNFALWSTGGSSDYSNDRDRPYNGQPHTNEGIRGKQEVSGVTMRDVRDCLIKAMLSCAQPELASKVEDNTWRIQDVYDIDFNHVDPVAVSQNLTCNIEKMMGIYPNIPKLTDK